MLAARRKRTSKSSTERDKRAYHFRPNSINIQFQGVDGFEYYRSIIGELMDGNVRFQMGLAEAICNAIQYGRGGPDQARVCITLRKTGKRLMAKVVSDSAGFDVQEKIRELQPLEALRHKNCGRGIGMMFLSADRVLFNAIGNEVILVTAA